MHTLRISTVVKNPSYKEENERMMGYSRNEMMPEFIDRDVTIVTLDEEQWKKVQKAIVEVLK